MNVTSYFSYDENGMIHIRGIVIPKDVFEKSFPQLIKNPLKFEFKKPIGRVISIIEEPERDRYRVEMQISDFEIGGIIRKSSLKDMSIGGEVQTVKVIEDMEIWEVSLTEPPFLCGHDWVNICLKCRKPYEKMYDKRKLDFCDCPIEPIEFTNGKRRAEKCLNCSMEKEYLAE